MGTFNFGRSILLDFEVFYNPDYDYNEDIFWDLINEENYDYLKEKIIGILKSEWKEKNHFICYFSENELTDQIKFNLEKMIDNKDKKLLEQDIQKIYENAYEAEQSILDEDEYNYFNNIFKTYSNMSNFLIPEIKNGYYNGCQLEINFIDTNYELDWWLCDPDNNFEANDISNILDNCKNDDEIKDLIDDFNENFNLLKEDILNIADLSKELINEGWKVGNLARWVPDYYENPIKEIEEWSDRKIKNLEDIKSEIINKLTQKQNNNQGGQR